MTYTPFQLWTNTTSIASTQEAGSSWRNCFSSWTLLNLDTRFIYLSIFNMSRFTIYILTSIIALMPTVTQNLCQKNEKSVKKKKKSVYNIKLQWAFQIHRCCDFYSWWNHHDCVMSHMWAWRNSWMQMLADKKLVLSNNAESLFLSCHVPTSYFALLWLKIHVGTHM